MAADDITVLSEYWSSRKTSTTRILKSDFGDGYSQRAGDGINTIKDTWEVEYRGPYGNIDTIITTLEGKAGHTSFLWTPPRGSQGKYICTQWTRSNLGRDTDSLTATFEEVFDL